MKRIVASIAVWTGLLALTIVAREMIVVLLMNRPDPASGDFQPISIQAFASRFLLEAIIFCVVGVISAKWIKSPPRAGLFALSLGIAYVIYVQSFSGLWYYLRSHPRALDEFFFIAPMLAPVIFPTAACLLWRVFHERSSTNAL